MQTTVVYYPYPAAEVPLSRDELAQVIGASLDGSPKLLQAMRQLLGGRLASATVDCARLQCEAREAGHAGGRVSELLSLQHELAMALKHAQELRGKGKQGRSKS